MYIQYFWRKKRNAVFKVDKQILKGNKRTTVNDQLTSWFLDPCAGRYWIRNRIRSVRGELVHWGCPRWKPIRTRRRRPSTRAGRQPSIFVIFFSFSFWNYFDWNTSNAEVDSMWVANGEGEIEKSIKFGTNATTGPLPLISRHNINPADKVCILTKI